MSGEEREREEVTDEVLVLVLVSALLCAARVLQEELRLADV